MDQQTGMIAIGVACVLLLGLATWAYLHHRRSKLLRDRFGPEYDRVVSQQGDVRHGEEVLAFLQKKHDALSIQPLSESDRREFVDRWITIQAEFVDDPEGSVTRADGLVNEVMEARGYPVVDFEERAGIISVDHPTVVENYRSAHAITEGRNRGQTTTEGLRKAMVQYRSLFEELLHDSLPPRKEARA